MSIEVKSEKNYYIVLVNGKFYCTEDTHKEAVETAKLLKIKKEI